MQRNAAVSAAGEADAGAPKQNRRPRGRRFSLMPYGWGGGGAGWLFGAVGTPGSFGAARPSCGLPAGVVLGLSPSRGVLTQRKLWAEASLDCALARVDSHSACGTGHAPGSPQ